MTATNQKLKIIFLLVVLLGALSCKKFLDEKSDKQLVVPSSLQDLQAILDYTTKMNNAGVAAGEASADDRYVTYADWSSLYSEMDRRMYVWEKDHLFDGFSNDWSKSYDEVYYANTVLEALEKIERNTSNGKSWDYVKGQALFHRANAFLQVLGVWCMAFDSASASTQLGIPLRLNTNFNEPSERASLERSYKQVIKDLQESIPLMIVTPVHVFRASRPAAYALLARTCLWMRDYTNAGKYADSCLQLKNTLLDYNSPEVKPSAAYSFQPFNEEVIFQTAANIPQSLNNSRAKIDSLLFASYDLNDLRKIVFFKNNNNGTYGFKGGYYASANLFTGPATDEMFLTRAECRAREGNVTGAMDDLNALLSHRYKTGTFTQQVVGSQADALTLILQERRKELLMRGLRWMDIKRLNKEGANISLKRILNGEIFELPANDARFAMPIPEDVLKLSGMPQNPR